MKRRYHYRPPPVNHPLLCGAATAVAIAPPASVELPPSIDLRSTCLPPRDQGSEGCCSAFSAAALREALHCIAAGAFLSDYLSPAYLYARTRMQEGTFPRDAGATVADEMATLQNYGVCPEAQLPYNQNPAESPSPVCDVAAVQYRLGTSIPRHVGFVGLVSVDAVRYALATNRAPIIFGMPVYESFEHVGPDGLVSIPVAGEKLLGGHAMLCVGYDDAAKQVIVRNSWGQQWGEGGYCRIPYQMVASWYEAWTAAPCV